MQSAIPKLGVGQRGGSRREEALGAGLTRAALRRGSGKRPGGCGGDYQPSQHLQTGEDSQEACAWCPTGKPPQQSVSGAKEPNFCTLSAFLDTVRTSPDIWGQKSVLMGLKSLPCSLFHIPPQCSAWIRSLLRVPGTCCSLGVRMSTV